MAMELEARNGRLEIRLPAVVDLPASSDLRDTLLDALARDAGADVVLRADAVERVSTAFAQVVLAAASGFRAAARRLEVEAPSPALTASFHHLGLEAELELLS